MSAVLDGPTALVRREVARLEIKGVDDNRRTFKGIASTSTADRVGDVVEPAGAKFKLPLPLLYQHDKSRPIGKVTAARVTKSGIEVDGYVEDIPDAPASLKERLDVAWAELKSGLVRGLSIGFIPLEAAFIKETGGLHILQWEWLELSTVTVPAQAEATLTFLKSVDEENQRAALLGNLAAGHSAVIRNSSSPAVAGKSATQSKGTIPVKISLAEQIAALEAKRAADDARRSDIQTKAVNEGRTKSDEERQEFEQLSSEISGIDLELRDLKMMEEQSKAAAVSAAQNRQDAPTTGSIALGTAARTVVPAGQIQVKSNLGPGIRFARAAMAMKAAGGNRFEASEIARKNAYWMSTSPEVVEYLKAAVPAADTTTAGWAAELVYNQNITNEFLEYLRPRTIIGQIDGWRRIPFNSRVGGMSAGLTGYWVGQGQPIPVSKGTTTATTLGMTKVAGIAALTDEIVRSSSPSAEAMVRDELAEACIETIDRSLIDPNMGGVANVQPASLTYGATSVAATGTGYTNLSNDLQTLVAGQMAADIDFQDSVLIMTPATAFAMSLMLTSLGNRQFPDLGPNGGTLSGFRVVTSRYVGAVAGSPNFGNMIVLINPREVYLADDGMVDIEISREASIQLLDNPTNASTGATTATSMVSMFQTHSEAVKAVRYINWAKRRDSAVAYIRNAAYTQA